MQIQLEISKHIYEQLKPEYDQKYDKSVQLINEQVCEEK